MGAGSYTNINFSTAVIQNGVLFRGKQYFSPAPEEGDPTAGELEYVLMKMRQGEVLYVQRNNDFEVQQVFLRKEFIGDRVSVATFHELLRRRRIITKHCFGSAASYRLTSWLERQVLLFKKRVR